MNTRVPRRVMLRITGHRLRTDFCAAIGDGRSAPILAFLKGKTVREICEYCEAEGWLVEVLPDVEATEAPE